MTFRLTKQHIRDGRTGSCAYCAVALTIRETLRGARVCADLQTIMVNGQVYDTPKKVRRFMGRFDYTKNRESLRGFTFELALGEGEKFA